MGEPGRGGGDRGWDPIGELQALRTELRRLVGSALVGGRSSSPDVELHQADDGWTVIARLPGVAPEEVALELDDRELCVRARSEAEVNADHGMAGSGTQTRAFEHRVHLPAPVDPERIDAVMDHGLLTVTLRKAARPGRRTITIGTRRYDPGQRSRSTSGAGLRPTVDPAADREMHRPDTAVGTPAPRFTG
ncbi:Hsp20/alpha crystallin family protein [Plantactinospora sp. S1510]|uniref:Hsp20/alpha crystallin family protein n=1 Tax=Plantactinospora alkalitolerans TaxID=2789879 RepID=A0ABS0GX50_9ACTN|nr:Hsp20/alpha crystallin family protein [Plantactinospora alkalitolerans]MBF9130780.1 Hsp20/alpha crystallin family protein [Plantactinospora alkalitolerans]